MCEKSRYALTLFAWLLALGAPALGFESAGEKETKEEEASTSAATQETETGLTGPFEVTGNSPRTGPCPH